MQYFHRYYCPLASEELKAPCVVCSPQECQNILDRIVKNPSEWLRQQRAPARYGDGFYYYVTFTRNPNSRYDRTAWLRAVQKHLDRRIYMDGYAAIEHIDTNIHCHAKVQSKKALCLKVDSGHYHFKAFARDYGHVHCVRIIVDNGIQEYTQKDMPTGTEWYEKTEIYNNYIDQM